MKHKRARSLGFADRAMWVEVARACPYATYFHTPAWAELMVHVYPGLSVAATAFRLADGTLVIFPLVESRRDAFFRSYESMVPGVYGGPIAERRLDAAEVAAILDAAVTSRTSRLRVFGNPHLDCFRAPADAAQEFTHVI